MFGKADYITQQSDSTYKIMGSRFSKILIRIPKVVSHLF